MKIVKTGDITRIFPDQLQTFDEIPVGNYKVCFHPMMGFYLEDADNFKLDEQAYGKHPQKIEKVMRLYESINRSAGVILSGKKGMGKSLFARLVSAEFATKHNMPTIIVADSFDGVVDFIESIKQECVVLFDEFEKVFDSGESSSGGFLVGGSESKKKSVGDTQEKMLGLFDGTSQTKRLYLVTVNDIKKVNQFMINRPGRFHYHLQFNYPSTQEIELYLKDKLKPEFYSQIPVVQRFSNRFDLNYDSLRAIAFDLNLGYSFMETMEDLNISSAENESISYNVAIHHSNGLVLTAEMRLNLMSSETSLHYNTTSGSDYAVVKFNPLGIDIKDKDAFVADADHVTIETHFDSDNQTLTKDSGITVTKLVFTKREYGRGFGGKGFEKFMA